MGEFDGAVDLAAMARKDDLVEGVRPNIKLVNVKTEQGQIQIPVLSLEFKMVNGEVRKAVCLGPQLIMPLIAFMSDYALKVGGNLQAVNEDGTPVVPGE